MNKSKVLFMGRKQVAAQCLENILKRSDVEIVGVLTDNHLDVSPTHDVAKKNNLRVYSFDSALSEMESGNLYFDIGFSVLYWRKLKGGFLSIPPKGVINFHPAILPQYKGTAGYNLAILDGLSEWAISAHYVDENIDTGGIVDVAFFPFCKETETAKSLESKSKVKIFDQFVRISDLALKSEVLLKVSPNVGGQYVSRNEMEIMKEVKPGDDVSRKIRAFWFPPYDGAFQWVNGVKCTLVDRTILNGLADAGSSSLFTPSST